MALMSASAACQLGSIHQLLPCCCCRLRIGIVGFGTFGQFLAQRMVKAGHEVGRGGGPSVCVCANEC